MPDDDVRQILEKIKAIAQGAVAKITDVSARDQVERIADLAESALNKDREKTGETDKGGH